MDIKCQERRRNWYYAHNTKMKNISFLERQALYDFTTGIPNKMFFKKKAEENIANFKKGEGPQAYVFSFDLDNFKLINDTLGHKEGDELLTLTAKTLSASFRAEDVVGRTGGDEFSAFAFTDRAGAEILTQRVAKNFQNEIDNLPKLNNLFLSLSIGFSRIGECLPGGYKKGESTEDDVRVDMTIKPEDAQKLLMDALEVADMRMYQVKNSKKAYG